MQEILEKLLDGEAYNSIYNAGTEVFTVNWRDGTQTRLTGKEAVDTNNAYRDLLKSYQIKAAYA